MNKFICLLITLFLLFSSFTFLVEAEVVETDADIIIKVGEKYTIEAVLKYMLEQKLPQNVTVNWETSNKSIATVSKGVVYGVSQGEATITATAVNNGKYYSAEAKIYVKSTVTGVRLDTEAIDLKVGQTQKLVETVLPVNALLKTVTWKTSDSSIATVSNGTVKGIKNGYAYVTVTTKDGNFSARCKVNVISTVTGIELEQHNLTKKIGESFTINAKIMPETAFLKDVKWTSSNTKVLSVAKGTLKALSKGEAVVTAETVDGQYKDRCTIKVESSVTGVKMNKSEMLIVKGSKETLAAIVLPEDAAEKGVVWNSDDKKIATVSNGSVTGVSEGKTIISATTKDGNFEAICRVEVISYEKKVEKIELADSKVTMNVGENKWFSYKIYPEDAVIPKLKATITSAEGKNANTIKLQNNLLYFEALRSGDYNLIVELADNPKVFDTCLIHIDSMVNGIEINKSYLNIYVGERAQLTGVALPETAILRGVTFKSSNSKIAKVNASTGEVTGVAAGQCEIIVSTIDGNLQKTCKVDVRNATEIESLKLRDAEGNIVGEKPQPEEEQVQETINDIDEEMPISITIDGEELECDQPAVQVNDRVLAPVRAIFEGLGASVEWDEDMQMVTGELEDIIIQMFIDKKKAIVNGKSVELDVPAQLIGSRTMVPVRFISENLGVSVDWDEEIRTVKIKR